MPDRDAQDAACSYTAAVSAAAGMSEQALTQWMDSFPADGRPEPPGASQQDQGEALVSSCHDTFLPSDKAASASCTAAFLSVVEACARGAGGCIQYGQLTDLPAALSCSYACDRLFAGLTARALACRCRQIWMWRVARPTPAALKARSCGLTASH